MRALRVLIVTHLVLLGSLTLVIYEAKSELEVSASVQISAPGDFYQPLAAHGSWVEVGSYGRCFRPAGIDAQWRPYCEGSWVWTDSGWYWDSAEPWAWACYHYGSWVDDPSDGWVWVPDIEWAPAWVTWREGGDYVGWAPCAPRGVTVAPALFVFVDTGHFQDPIRRTSVVINNAVAIQQTRVLAGPGRESRNVNGRTEDVVVNRGPDVQQIQKATGRTLKAVPVQNAGRATVVPRDLGTSDSKNEPASTKDSVQPNRANADKPAATEKNNQATPDRQRDLQSARPSNNQPVPVERPETPAKQETPPTSGSEDKPVISPRQDMPQSGERDLQPARPVYGPPVPGQRPESAPKQATPAPRRDSKPVNPPKENAAPKEDKPANPPPEQERKDGLEGSSRMMAGLFSNVPSSSGS